MSDDVTEQMAAHIRRCRGRFTDDAIRGDLAKDGYPPEQIEAAFRFAAAVPGLSPEPELAEEAAAGEPKRPRALIAAGVLLVSAVIALAGYLLAERVAKADAKKKAVEASTKASLISLRSALAIHYGNSDGRYPPGLGALVPAYMTAFPSVKTGHHPPSSAVESYRGDVCAGADRYSTDPPLAAKLRDSGGWGYVVDPKATCWGDIFIDCTHRDSAGKSWHAF